MSPESHSINSFGSTVTFRNIFLEVFQKGKGYRRKCLYTEILTSLQKSKYTVEHLKCICIEPKEISMCATCQAELFN